MKIALGQFARTGIEAHLGSDLPAGVQTALRRYSERLEAGAGPLEVPAFPRPLRVAEPKLVVEVSVDAACAALLEQEALRQGTTVDVLAAHSVLLYLAELDLRQGSRAAS